MPITKPTTAEVPDQRSRSASDSVATVPMQASSIAATPSRIDLLRDPVGDHTAEQRRQDHADRAGGRHDRELSRTAADPDDLPDQADRPHAARERREHERDREPPVRRVPERVERARQPPPAPRPARAPAPRSSLLLPTVWTERTDIAHRIHRGLVSTTLPSARRSSRSACARAASASGYVVTSGRHSPGGHPLERAAGEPGIPPGQRRHPGAEAPPGADPAADQVTAVERASATRPRTRTSPAGRRGAAARAPSGRRRHRRRRRRA